MASGKLFHAHGPATAKAQWSNVDRCVADVTEHIIPCSPLDNCITKVAQCWFLYLSDSIQPERAGMAL